MIEPKDQDVERSLFSCLSILQTFSNKEGIEQFITKNEKVVNRRILDSMDLNLIVKLAEFYFKINAT